MLRKTVAFEDKIMYEALTGCWLWTGSISSGGYGRHWSNGFKYAHRISWEMSKGLIPGGMTIDHLCRNRACVNPDHMEVVTAIVNTLRGSGPTADNRRKTHCAHGHAYTEENTIYYTNRRSKSGTLRRVCRNCTRRGEPQPNAYSPKQARINYLKLHGFGGL
jgi:hypothetical protein